MTGKLIAILKFRGTQKDWIASYLASVLLAEHCIDLAVESTILGFVTRLSVVVHTAVVCALQPKKQIIV